LHQLRLSAGTAAFPSANCGDSGPFVTVENPTSIHALLKDAQITLSSGGWSTVLAPGALQNVLGTGLVQPRHERTFVLPVDVPAGINRLAVAVDYRPAK
jgi:P pilus assembly chaperone PapD